MAGEQDPRAPMASAPMKYREDGAVDWGNMWDSFCVLAQEGGPPHRATMLEPQSASDVTSPAYQAAVTEIIRGIAEVSGLQATPDQAGWIAIACLSPGQARWLAGAIAEENVRAQAEGNLLRVPVGESFTLKGEIKNVITAVAKTTHYWDTHLPAEVKATLAIQDQAGRLRERVTGWFKKPRVGETG